MKSLFVIGGGECVCVGGGNRMKELSRSLMLSSLFLQHHICFSPQSFNSQSFSALSEFHLQPLVTSFLTFLPVTGLLKGCRKTPRICLLCLAAALRCYSGHLKLIKIPIKIPLCPVWQPFYPIIKGTLTEQFFSFLWSHFPTNSSIFSFTGLHALFLLNLTETPAWTADLQNSSIVLK